MSIRGGLFSFSAGVEATHSPHKEQSFRIVRDRRKSVYVRRASILRERSIRQAGVTGLRKKFAPRKNLVTKADFPGLAKSSNSHSRVIFG